MNKLSRMTGVLMLAFHVACLGAGCERGSSAKSPRALTDQERRSIEEAISLQLPSDVVVLVATDGGGREASVGYYKWLFHSETGIQLTPEDVPSPSGHLVLDSDDGAIAEWIQSLVDRKLPPWTAASWLNWTDGTYNFQSDLLVTEEGDYLCVQRFRRKDQ